ncbi:MAG: tetratricopeptide repeat protein [Pseudomonadota bacterium]
MRASQLLRAGARRRAMGITVALTLVASLAAADSTVPKPDLSESAEPVRESLTAEAARMTALLSQTEDAWALASGWLALGDSYFAHDFYAEALTAYAAAQGRVGEQGPILYRVGLAHMAEGRAAPGVAAFDVAISDLPDSLRMPAFVRRGRARLDLGDTAGARNDFEAALRLAPESPAALGGLGRAELAAGDAAKARDYLKRALELDPAATRLHQPLGMAYRTLGNIPAARAILADVGDGEPTLSDPVIAAIAQRSRSPQFFVQTGLAQADRGNFDAAADFIGRAVALAPDDLTIVATHGRVLAESGNYGAARAAFERVTDADAASAEDWLYLGRIEQAEGQFKAAKVAFQNAIALNAKDSTARESLARILLHEGGFDEATTIYEALASETRARDERGRLNYWAAVSALGAGDCPGALKRLSDGLAGEPPFDAALLQASARAWATCPGTGAAHLQTAQSWSEDIYLAAPGVETARTLAMVYAALDRFEDAVDLQAEAMFEVLKLTGLERRPELQADMARYRSGQPALRAYAATDPLFQID